MSSSSLVNWVSCFDLLFSTLTIFLLFGLKLIFRYCCPFLISIGHIFCWAAYTPCHFKAISFNASMQFLSRCFLKFILCLPSLPFSLLPPLFSTSLSILANTQTHILYYIVLYLLILSLGISYASIYFVSHFDNMQSMHKESSPTSFAQKLGPSKLHWVSKIVWLIYSLICSFIQQIFIKCLICVRSYTKCYIQ